MQLDKWNYEIKIFYNSHWKESYAFQFVSKIWSNFMNYFDGLRWSQKTNPEKLLKHFVQDWKHTKAGEAGILKKFLNFCWSSFLIFMTQWCIEWPKYFLLDQMYWLFQNKWTCFGHKKHWRSFGFKEALSCKLWLQNSDF